MISIVKKSGVISNVGFIFVFFFLPFISAAQTWAEVIKLGASDAAEAYRFGNSVAIEGDRAIIGSFYNSGVGSRMGAVYFVELDGGVWIESQKITASDAEANDFFGTKLSISGDRIVIGAYGNDDDGGNSGAAYIFDWDGDEWVEAQILTASDAAAGDMFGKVVSIAGDRVIIGAEGNDDAGAGSGCAYIFELEGDVWGEVQKITASDAAAADIFGNDVSIAGERVIVGAMNNSDAGSATGSAYIFEWDGVAWIETQKLLASDADLGNYFGYAVDIEGDRVIVGAVFDGDDLFASGSAYIFDWDGVVWVETQKLTASDAAEEDFFGTSVSISGDKVVIGAMGNNAGEASSGAAYIFEWDGVIWSETEKLSASDLGVEDYFGNTVAIDGDRTIIGAFFNDDDGNESGSAYIFQICAPFEVTANADDNTVCLGDEVILTGGGATTYTWDGGVIDGEAFEPEIGITTFTVTGTDDSGCENTATIDITVFETLVLSYLTNDELFGGDALIDLTVSGGNPTYSFDWDNDGTGDFDDDEDLASLVSGTYTVIVIDEAGCSATETIEITSQIGIETLTSSIQVYPNPSSAFVTIQVEGAFTYSLLNLNGQVLVQSNAINTTTIDLYEFATGVYFITLNTTSVSQTLKFVKQ